MESLFWKDLLQKAEAEVEVIKKHLTDAENIVIPFAANAWKTKGGVSQKQQEKDALILSLKQKLSTTEMEVMRLREMQKEEEDLHMLNEEIYKLDLQIMEDSKQMYVTGPPIYTI
jgi:hypothetical protein